MTQQPNPTPPRFQPVPAIPIVVMQGPWYWKEWLRDHGSDRYAATRRAIVRAAAALAA